MKEALRKYKDGERVQTDDLIKAFQEIGRERSNDPLHQEAIEQASEMAFMLEEWKATPTDDFSVMEKITAKSRVVEALNDYTHDYAHLVL